MRQSIAWKKGNFSNKSVAWIDCLAGGASPGRSLIYLAEHATRQDWDPLAPDLETFEAGRQPRVSAPKRFPARLLNRASMRVLGELCYQRGAVEGGKAAAFYWIPISSRSMR